MSKRQLDPSKLEELRVAFSRFDRNGDGTIDRAELASMFEALDADMTADEIAVGMSVIDRNRDGRVSLNEFLAWWTER